MDGATAALLDAAMAEAFRDATVLTVAHRLPVVLETCDRVAVMSNGRVAEEGRPRWGGCSLFVLCVSTPKRPLDFEFFCSSLLFRCSVGMISQFFSYFLFFFCSRVLRLQTAARAVGTFLELHTGVAVPHADPVYERVCSGSFLDHASIIRRFSVTPLVANMRI